MRSKKHRSRCQQGQLPTIGHIRHVARITEEKRCAMNAREDLFANMVSKRVGAKYAGEMHYAFMASKKAGALRAVGRGSACIQGFVASARSVYLVHVNKCCSLST